MSPLAHSAGSRDCFAICCSRKPLADATERATESPDDPLVSLCQITRQTRFRRPDTAAALACLPGDEEPSLYLRLVVSCLPQTLMLSASLCRSHAVPRGGAGCTDLTLIIPCRITRRWCCRYPSPRPWSTQARGCMLCTVRIDARMRTHSPTTKVLGAFVIG